MSRIHRVSKFREVIYDSTDLVYFAEVHVLCDFSRGPKKIHLFFVVTIVWVYVHPVDRLRIRTSSSLTLDFLLWSVQKSVGVGLLDVLSLMLHINLSFYRFTGGGRTIMTIPIENRYVFGPFIAAACHLIVIFSAVGRWNLDCIRQI